MTLLRMVALCLVLGGITCAAVAQDAPVAAKADSAKAIEKPQFGIANAMAIIGACFGAGIAAIGGGIGISRIGSSCLEAIALQPEASGAMFGPMVITAAMVEGGMLFAIVVCMLGVLYI